MSEQEAKLYEIMGKMLKEARLKAGFTLEQAGEKIGVIAKTIQRYETGQRKISMDKLMELTSLFGVDYTSFISAAKRRLSEETSADFAGDHQADDGYYLDD